MKTNKRILVVGEVMVDNYVDAQVVTLGGIMHAAKMLRALETPFALAGIVPSYLSEQFLAVSRQLQAEAAVRFGTVQNCPNVRNVRATKDIFGHDSEELLADIASIQLNSEALEVLIKDFQPTDIIIYTGKFDYTVVGKIANGAHIHLNVCHSLRRSALSPIQLETIMLSTSTTLFKELGHTVEGVRNHSLAKRMLVKENRGGATLFANGEVNEAPAFLTHSAHPALGDAYSAAFIATNSLHLAAFYVGEYAATLDFEQFVRHVKAVSEEEILALSGVRVPWDERSHMHIYIAGADFPIKDRTLFEQVDQALKFHNFASHRPIVENGVFTGQEPYHLQQAMYNKDLFLMEKAALTVAVLTENDPGTLVEIGWMDHKRTPTILFDPYKIAHNLFLKKSVTCIVHTVEDVIFETFNLLNQNN